MKKIISLVLCFILIFSFAACGEQNPEKQAYEELINGLEEQKMVAINPRVDEDSKGQKYIAADVKNKTNTEVTDVVLAFAVWNYKGQPVIIKSQNNPRNTNYEVRMSLQSSVKIPPADTWNGIGGIFLNKNCPSIKYVKAIVLSCKMGGVTYKNPHYKKWRENHINKPLEEWMK